MQCGARITACGFHAQPAVPAVILRNLDGDGIGRHGRRGSGGRRCCTRWNSCGRRRGCPGRCREHNCCCRRNRSRWRGTCWCCWQSCSRRQNRGGRARGGRQWSATLDLERADGGPRPVRATRSATSHTPPVTAFTGKCLRSLGLRQPTARDDQRCAERVRVVDLDLVGGRACDCIPGEGDALVWWQLHIICRAN